jgi:hypothetical protein
MTRRVILVSLVLCLAACADLTSTQQRTATGGLGGAAAGAALGAIGGNAGLGAAAGAAAGLIGGYLFDQHKKAEQNAYQQGVTDAQRGRAGSSQAPAQSTSTPPQ